MTRSLITCLILASLIVTSCTTPPPEKYFDVAVLNTNMLHGFAGEGMERELEAPSLKAVPGTDKPVQMPRKEVVESTLKFNEEAYGKVNELKETEDAKDIMQASKALYAFVLPVYKNEYTQLADLYDKQAPKESIDALQKNIREKYEARFMELYAALTTSGKAYAQKHNINVKWAD
ncbi:MAG TPA: hypothetical protein VHK91_02605 [Flavisolibacter sp.]|jgi:hypothetical protein|nr:hypothetical protein [Flavisolibacter sp.]